METHMDHRSGAGSILVAAILLIAPFSTMNSHSQDSAATSAGPASGSTDEAPFLAENAAAMSKMMAGMDIKPTGDVDADFAAMMIPHHQGAIEMALAVLRYGKNEQLRRIAQEIIVTQQQEIAAMRLALGQPLPPSAPAPTQVAPSGPTPSANTPRAVHGHGRETVPMLPSQPDK